LPRGEQTELQSGAIRRSMAANRSLPRGVQELKVTQEGNNLHLVKEILLAAVEDSRRAVVTRKSLQQMDETRLVLMIAWNRYFEANVEYSLEGPRELHHAMLECEMLKGSCIKVLEEMAEYLKSGEAPPEVVAEEEVKSMDPKVKEQMVFKAEEKFDLKVKEIIQQVQIDANKPPDKLKVGANIPPEVEMREDLSKNQVAMELTCKQFGVKDKEIKSMKKEVRIGNSGGLDPGEVVTVNKELVEDGAQELVKVIGLKEMRDLVEEVDSLDMKEESAIKATSWTGVINLGLQVKQVQNSGGLDPGERVTTDEVQVEVSAIEGWKEVIGLKDLVEGKQVEVLKQELQEVDVLSLVDEARLCDPMVRVLVLLGNLIFDAEFELLVAWQLLMLHMAEMLRLSVIMARF